MSSSQLTGLASYTTADTSWVHYVSPDQWLIRKPRQGLADLGAACLTLHVIAGIHATTLPGGSNSPWIAPGIICDLGMWLPYRPPHR